MIFSKQTAGVMLALIGLSACHSSKKVSGSQYKLMDTITVSARNNPMDIYRATSPRVWNIVHSSVELRFDFAKRQADGKAILSLSPYTTAPDSLALDAKDMLIKRVALLGSDGHELESLHYSYDSTMLKIALRNPLVSFGTLTTPETRDILIEYTAMPYAREAGGSAAITEDRGLYFINTDRSIPGKPVQIWTQGETESNSHWLPTIDKPNQRTTTDITLIVPDTMQTLSNGRMVNSSALGGGLRRDEWKMEQPIQVYAIMFAIGRFEVAKESYHDAQGQAHDVNYYTEPVYAPHAKGMFKNTPEMIEYFSQATGVPYAWNTYSQIVVRDYVSGAMENTSASLFGEFINQNARQLIDGGTEDVVSHELFHQWFGDYVTAESWSNLTLNESFATFGELLWRRHKYGQAYTDELAIDDLGRYLSSTERGDPPLVRYYYRDREQMFDRVSYQKGGAILRYIQSIAGDSLFNRAMKAYLTKNALKSAEASQWRLALEEATGEDWNVFFNQWYYRGGHPVLKVRYAYDNAAKKLRVTVRQNGSPDSTQRYILPLQAEIIYDANNKHVEHWVIKDRVHTFSYPYENGQRPLVIPDALHVLPGVINEEKTPADWLREIRYSDNYISKRQAVNAATQNTNDANSIQIVEAGLADNLASIRAYTLIQLARVAREGWIDVLKPKVAYLLQTDNNNKVRSACLTVIGAWKLKNLLGEVVPDVYDSSYLVAGSALNALRELEPDSAYHMAEGLRGTDPHGLLLPAVWTSIVSRGDASDIGRFETLGPTLYGTVRVSFADNLQVYATSVKDDQIYERTLTLLMRLVNSESIKGYRFAIGSNIFELQQHYKEVAAQNTKESKAASVREKIAQQYVNRILSEEKDPGNLKAYENLEN